MSRVRVVERGDRRLLLRIEGYSVPLVNAVRRVILAEVPALAVDYAIFYDNNTPIYDEMISHRLGLVVLKSDEVLDSLKSPEECRGKTYEDDPDCFVKLSLDVEVPADSSEGRYVYARELRIEDPRVEPVYPDTPIAYVGPGQAVRLVAYARLGRGKEHGRFSPATIAALRYTPIVEVNPPASEECLACLQAYPEVVEALKRGKPTIVRLEGSSRTSGLVYCSEQPCKGSVRVRYDPSVLFLEIEVTGALPPERVVVEALNILEEKIKRFREAVRSAGITEEVSLEANGPDEHSD